MAADSSHHRYPETELKKCFTAGFASQQFFFISLRTYLWNDSDTHDVCQLLQKGKSVCLFFFLKRNQKEKHAETDVGTCSRGSER